MSFPLLVVQHTLALQDVAHVLPEMKSDLPHNTVVFPNNNNLIHSKNFNKIVKALKVENEYYEEETNILLLMIQKTK